MQMTDELIHETVALGKYQLETWTDLAVADLMFRCWNCKRDQCIQ